MILLSLEPFRIADDTLWVSNTELGSHVGNDPDGDIDGINKKGAQKSERSDLQREAQTVMVSTALGNECTILIIQVKITGKLLRCRLTNIAAIPLFLFISQIIDRHSTFFVFLFIEHGFSL